MTLPGQITGVHTVGVPVTDQDRAIDFYVGTLGFDKRLDADMGGGRRWIEVAPARQAAAPRSGRCSIRSTSRRSTSPC